MAYISSMLSVNQKKVYVWERDGNGRRVKKDYDAPYYFFVPDETGEHKDIDGNGLTKLEFTDPKEFRAVRNGFKRKSIPTFESDIRPESKILSEHYSNKKINPLNITFYDIEVDYDRTIGFSSPNNPYAPISSIALYHYWSKKAIILAVPPSDQEWTVDMIDEDIRDKSTIFIFKNEKELLQKFLKEIANSDIVSGWYSRFFDDPYIYERIKKTLGKDSVKKLGFPDARWPKIKEVEKFKTMHKTVVISGRVFIDYLELFKKFEMSLRPSYSLDAISEEMLPDLPKLSYPKTLWHLYREDFNHFIRYNLRDTEILRGFEDKLGYMNVAIDMSHMSTGAIGDVLGTIKLVEGAITNYAHEKFNCQVPDVEIDESLHREKFTGALVLTPQVGMHENVSQVDAAAVYPNAIMTLNASPETIIGQFDEYYRAYDVIKDSTNGDHSLTLTYESGEREERMASEWRTHFIQKHWAISGHGTIFDQNKKGIIPSILNDWYQKRKTFKKRMFTAKNEIERIEKAEKLSKDEKKRILELKQEAEYCDRIQYILKIKLNSAYGAMGNNFFRFFDIRLAESTTRTGREILTYMGCKVSELLIGEHSLDTDAIIYGDTDSIYFKTYASDIEEAERVGKAIERGVNKTFSTFMKDAFLCSEKNSHFGTVEQELVADRGIFVGKKYYALHLVRLDGYVVDKMKIMGLAIKKTVIPKPIQKHLSKYIERMLKGESWLDISKDVVAYKDELLYNANILDIGIPTGINNVEDYTRRYNSKEEGLRLPGHVAAAMFWNRCLQEFEDKESYEIRSGFSIKKFYFKKKFGKFKSIAIPIDTLHLPDWFLENFEQYIDRKAQLLRLIDMPLKTILTAIGEKPPTAKSVLIDEYAEY